MCFLNHLKIGVKIMSRKIRVGIVGASGYAGVELVKLLSKHSGAELACVTSRSLAGTKVADNMPGLRHLLNPELAQLICLSGHSFYFPDKSLYRSFHWQLAYVR